jgi:predicted Zn-dependent protease
MGQRLGTGFLRMWQRLGRLRVFALLVVLVGVGAVVVYRWGFYDLRAAHAAAAQHHLDDARQHVQAYLLLWPRSADAHFLAAQVLRRAGAVDEAQRHLDECERLSGERSDALKLEGILLQVQQGDIPSDTERYLGERYLNRNAPETPLILEALAGGYFQQLALPAAVECLNRCLQEQPQNISARFLRGRTQERLNSVVEALDDYRQVLDLEPSHHDARLRLAELLLRAGQAEEAERHFAKLLRRSASDPAARLGLARCRYHAGQAEEARRCLDALLAENPRNLGALREQGRLALEAGSGAEAETCLRRALALDASDRETQHLLVQALQQQGKTEEASRERERSDRLATDLMRLQEILSGEMSRRPRDPALLSELGTLFLRYGKEEEGVRCLRRALESDPNYGPALHALADHTARQPGAVP